MNDTLDKELREIEAQLANLNPSKMPDDMILRMEKAMISWGNSLPTEKNIVPFHKSEPAKEVLNIEKSDNVTIWAAVAAIALMTGVASVFMSNSSSQPTVVEVPATPAPSVAIETPVTTTSPELSRNIVHASNEGFTYSDNNDEAFKVLRIEYTEKVVTRDKNGNTVTTEKPCLEHVLVPIPVH